MGLNVEVSISAVTVFLQGLLSFFSPCVLPLLPVYIGYLSGGVAEDGSAGHRRARTLINTLYFIVGVSAAFFLLGLGMTAIGMFFGNHRQLFARLGGVVVMMFGMYQLGIFKESAALSTERRLPLRLDKLAMSPWTALLMGFVFSFAWTPCVGPALSSVLLMAASSTSRATGFLLIGVYTLGFVLPFLAVGLFTNGLLELFRRHSGVVKYTVKIGGALMILMGVLMITGVMSGSASDTAAAPAAAPIAEEASVPAPEAPAVQPTEAPAAAAETQTEAGNAPDFRLPDQYGVLHSLSDYRGKVIFLNFWATWCPPCRSEMPDIQALYEAYSADPDSEVVILGVAFPGIGGEEDAEGVAEFLSENGYTYPVVMDEDGALMAPYAISAFPTTFMIDKNGDVFGYLTGAMSREIMEEIIRQTLESGG